MLHTILSEKARRYPDKPAIVHGGRRISYGDLERMTSQLASFLLCRGGLQPGDRVGIFSENSPEYAAALLGVQRARGISVDINPQYSAHEAGRIVVNSSPTVLIVESRFLPVAWEVLAANPFVRVMIVVGARGKGFELSGNSAQADAESCKVVAFDDIMTETVADHVPATGSPDEIASIVFTSGTTGAPKGIMLSHANFMANACSIVEYLRLTADDTVMCILPFCYSYGKSLLTTHLAVGGTIILENSFMYPNLVFEKMVEEEVTGFAGVPSTFAIMLNRSNIAKYRFPKLRYITQAGGHMPPAHAQQLAALFPDVALYIMYGQTEATSRLTYLDPQELSRKPGSIGKAIPGVTIDLLKENGDSAEADEVGEIVAAGGNVMAGYWNNPEETARVLRGGWLHTGDLAKRDSEGFLYVVGRRSDMIKSGAHRISPQEIEDVILEMGDIHEVCVTGMHDEILGEIILACAVLKRGCSLDEKKVQQHCRSKLAAFKIPKAVFFVPELPKTASGKVQRHLVHRQRER